MIPRRERPPVDGVRDGIPRRVRDGGGGAYPTLCFRVLTARSQRVALALVIAGCGGGLIRWHRIDPPPVGRRPPNQRLQIWSGREALRWRAVVIGRDSVSGIPDPMPITCDSCRRRLPFDRRGLHPATAQRRGGRSCFSPSDRSRSVADIPPRHIAPSPHGPPSRKAWDVALRGAALYGAIAVASQTSGVASGCDGRMAVDARGGDTNHQRAKSHTGQSRVRSSNASP